MVMEGENNWWRRACVLIEVFKQRGLVSRPHIIQWHCNACLDRYRDFWDTLRKSTTNVHNGPFKLREAMKTISEATIEWSKPYGLSSTIITTYTEYSTRTQVLIKSDLFISSLTYVYTEVSSKRKKNPNKPQIYQPRPEKLLWGWYWPGLYSSAPWPWT